MELWLIAMVIASTLLLLSLAFLIYAIMLAFKVGDFEPIEPKGKVEHKEAKDKNR